MFDVKCPARLTTMHSYSLLSKFGKFKLFVNSFYLIILYDFRKHFTVLRLNLQPFLTLKQCTQLGYPWENYIGYNGGGFILGVKKS